MQEKRVCLPFPGKVVRGAGALKELGQVAEACGSKAFVLGGRTALAKTKQTIASSLGAANITIVAEEWYGGEVTKENIRQLAQKALALKADFILAVGGGKALDTGKAAAAESRLPVITVPTIAATCAAVTPLTVLYNEKGEFAGNLFLADCPAVVVVDSEVLLDAPVVWLEAGIGDALAKMYELRAAAARMTPDSITISAAVNGEICYDIIRRFGSKAREAVEKQAVSSEFESTIDAIIVIAGLSSIFGGDKLRNAAAHAIYNGFTKIPATHAVAHGLIVGYGNLCLLALEERSDEEIMAEIRLAASCGIPVKLSQIADMTEAELMLAAAASAQAAAMRCMPFTVTPEMVIRAIKRVNKLAESL
ncbi:MAG: iron-containing alcohol dehydrogenase family protein [Negativicutes bacterium]|nr:iron-containing alcohol dehydrogenase family protein [Negativicutes bacterium]